MIKIKVYQKYSEEYVKNVLLNNNKAVLYCIKLLNKYGKYGDGHIEQYKNKYGKCGPNTFDAPIFLDYQNKMSAFGGLYYIDIINARYRLYKYIKQITNILNLEYSYKNGEQLEWKLS